MNQHRDPLPPLDPSVREAIEAFRQTRPSPQLEARISAALASPDARAPRDALPLRRSRGPRVLTALVFAGAALGVAALAVVVREQHAVAPRTTHTVAPREIAVTLPPAGATWVNLPWRLASHTEPEATVHVEANECMVFHAQPEVPAIEIERKGERCMHRWVTRTGSAETPLRVQIHNPGRYEFRVTHASRSRLFHEHFVVLATR